MVMLSLMVELSIGKNWSGNNIRGCEFTNLSSLMWKVWNFCQL